MINETLYSSASEEFRKFLKKTKKVSSGCIVWIKCKDKDGYGNTTYKGKQIRAHRLSFKLFNGYLKRNLCVCHKCDNPSCVNPYHLFLATNRQNTKDRYLKNRSAIGERISSSKLNIKKVKEIRNKYIPKKYSIRKLAREYNVCYATMRELLINKNWKHVK